MTGAVQRSKLGVGERGQASLLVLGLLAALPAGTLVLFSFGQALGARGKQQRAADLAAVSTAQVMSRNYSRLFEPAVFENGMPNPHHLSNEAYLALARAAALRGARRNGVSPREVAVAFPDAAFAPTRIEVATSGDAGCGWGSGLTSGSESGQPPRPRSPPTWVWRSECPRTGREAATTRRSPTGRASPPLICFPLCRATLLG